MIETTMQMSMLIACTAAIAGESVAIFIRYTPTAAAVSMMYAAIVKAPGLDGRAKRILSGNDVAYYAH